MAECKHKHMNVISGSRNSFTGQLLIELECRTCKERLTKEYEEIE